ncbi:SCO0607 family lipoprotein [Dactylosporangium salmoneum]|uniref:Lipoprotein n=1 Tax=Dactylosporangium salmoneum TaxID=53361 RepID=A0ABN3HFD9_9ACTN
MRRFLALLLATALLPAAGCHVRERICGSDSYPAKAVGNTTGRTCVPDGQDPPAGYVRYPKDKQPVYVDDQWDRYWRTVTVDEHGNIVSTATPSPAQS